MENHYKEMLRFQLMEEIARINDRVAALGTPRGTRERSLIARYGKLLFVSQQLLDTLPKFPSVTDVARPVVETRSESDANPVIPKQVGGSFSRRFGLA